MPHYLEMERYQRKDQCLEILHKVVEDTKALWIRRVLHILQ
jgi:hypothetical protein